MHSYKWHGRWPASLGSIASRSRHQTSLVQDIPLSLWVGRLGVLLGLITFIVTYLFCITHFGLLTGYGLGWLFAATAGWGVAKLLVLSAHGILARRRPAA